MNKDEIKKGLKYCTRLKGFEGCRKCPYFSTHRCNDTLCKDALNLITKQEKKIGRLKNLSKLFENNMKWVIEDQKKQAVKEFAEKVKEKALSHCRTINCYECKFIETTIDDILEEYEK